MKMNELQNKQNERDEPGKPDKIKHFLFMIAKIILSAVLLYLVFSRAGIKNIYSCIMQTNPFIFIITAGIYIIVLLLTALRLRMLLPVKLPLKKLFSLSAIGSFFNMYVPSGIGGDIVKLYYLTKKDSETGNKIAPATALTVIFIEKYLGLGAIFFLGLVAYPFNIGYIGKQLKWLWIFPAGFVVFFVSTGILLNFRIGKQIKFLSGMYDCFQYYRNKKIILFYAFSYSLTFLLVSILYIYTIGLGLKVQIPFLYLFFITPVIHLVIMFPVTFAGLGVREGAFVILLKAVGVSPSFAISMSLISLLATIPGSFYGLVEYLRYKHAEQVKL